MRNLSEKGVEAAMTTIRCRVHKGPVYEMRAAISAYLDASERESFQKRVRDWGIACFGEAITDDCVERNHRFLEEALELVQSLGCTRSEAHQLVDYVFDRPVGEPSQELGGVMVTLALLANAHGLDYDDAAEAELARVWTKIEMIRTKQAKKPKYTPLTQHIETPLGDYKDLCHLSSRLAELDATERETPPGDYESLCTNTENFIDRSRRGDVQGLVNHACALLTQHLAAIRDLSARLTEAERDAERLQKIGEQFGFIGGENRVSAVERVLTEQRDKIEALDAKVRLLAPKLAKAREALRTLLDCPDIADNDYKDEETHAAERIAHDTLADLDADAPANLGPAEPYKRINELENECARLREALKPFADALDKADDVYCGAHLDEWTLNGTTASQLIKMQDLRRARAALSAQQGGE